MNNLQFAYRIEDALTPLDGRNRHKLTSLTPYFSEKALNSYRIYVETEYLKKMSDEKIIRTMSPGEIKKLDVISSGFGQEEYKKLRSIELVVNHDVQAVVVYIQKTLEKTTLKDISPMVHFGITSEDVNNIAYALMIKDAVSVAILPELEGVLRDLLDMSALYKSIVMPGRTHGQMAVPTTFGKEISVYANRLLHELKIFSGHRLKAKFNGNVGNFNSHVFVFPHINWIRFSKEFVSSLGLIPDLHTTQIEPYDSYIFLFQTLYRINNILNGLCRDLWFYASLGYCRQKAIKKEVGSSALPHKVNPIYLEGAEGGLGIANALLSFYSDKLSYSRLQRDLSDSTVRRSFSIAFSYSLLSYQSVREGLKRIEPDGQRMTEELGRHFEILSEAVQNLLRLRGHKNAYEKTKSFFRGKIISPEMYRQFVDTLDIPASDKKTLINLTPVAYTGVAQNLAV